MSYRKVQKRFVHPNFDIDYRVERKFKQEFNNLLQMSLEKVAALHPDLSAKEQHGTALTYVFLKKENVKLNVKMKVAAQTKARKAQILQAQELLQKKIEEESLENVENKENCQEDEN